MKCIFVFNGISEDMLSVEMLNESRSDVNTGISDEERKQLETLFGIGMGYYD